MKFRVHLKDPDGFAEPVMDAADDSVKAHKILKAMQPWVRFGEYISIEFDTDTGTATVLKSADTL